jgi:hypothetical protein
MTSDHSSPDRIDSHFSRRDLFRTIGLATGGAMLLGLPKVFGGGIREAEAATIDRGFASGNLSLELDGVAAGPVLTAEGGNAFADVILEAVGQDSFQRKRQGPAQYEDLLLNMPLGGASRPLSDWIIESLGVNPRPRNGAIVYMDFDFNETKRLEFFNAVITEVVIPACDGADKSPSTLTLHITPQSTRLAGGGGKKLTPAAGLKSKAAFAGNFRFNVQGLEKACTRIGKVEAITITRVLPAGTSSQDARKQPLLGAPGSLTVSNIRIFAPEADAGPLYGWFDSMVLKGNAGDERAGVLEWLDPTMKNVTGSAQLNGLGILRYAPEGAKAGGTGKLSLVQVDMYCESIKLAL